MSRRQYTKELDGPRGNVGRLEVEHIGYSSMGDPEYRYAVHDHSGKKIVGAELRTLEGHEPDARRGMRVLLHWLGEAARAYQDESRRASSAGDRLLPQVVVWAHGCREELAAASEALNVELSSGLDR